jgi:hypothetical protein
LHLSCRAAGGPIFHNFTVSEAEFSQVRYRCFFASVCKVEGHPRHNVIPFSDQMLDAMFYAVDIEMSSFLWAMRLNLIPGQGK